MRVGIRKSVKASCQIPSGQLEVGVHKYSSTQESTIDISALVKDSGETSCVSKFTFGRLSSGTPASAEDRIHRQNWVDLYAIVGHL